LKDFFLIFKNNILIFREGNLGVELEARSKFKLIKGIFEFVALVSSDSFVTKEQKVDAFDNFPISI